MKLSVFLCSYSQRCEEGASTRELVEEAARQGFGAVEPFPAADLGTVAQAASIGSLARGLGLEVSCFSTCADLLSGDPADALAALRQRIDMAAAMGSPYFHHTIYPPLTLPRAGGPTLAGALRRAVPMLRELCGYAADRGVRCVYEDQGMLFNGRAAMERLTEALGDAPFGLVADVGNVFFTDERPEDWIGALSAHIVHVHCKDYLLKPGSGPCPGRGWYVTRRGDYLRDTVPGHGAVDYPAVFRVLSQIGYDGWYSLEYAAMEPASFGIDMAADNLRRLWEDTARSPVQFPLLDGISPRFV